MTPRPGPRLLAPSCRRAGPSVVTSEGGRPAVFLDRDGTVIEDRDYLSDPAGVRLLPGAARGMRRLADAGYALVIATNQSGIARGLFGEADYRAVRARLDELLAAAGVRLAGTYHCPHHPDFTGPCACRKPAPGMFLRAARELGLDLARSVLVGDRVRDVAPAADLGARAILVGGDAAAIPEGGRAPITEGATAAAKLDEAAATAVPRSATAAANLDEAADLILGTDGGVPE